MRVEHCSSKLGLTAEAGLLASYGRLDSRSVANFLANFVEIYSVKDYFSKADISRDRDQFLRELVRELATVLE